jgi:hypothetical protein
MKVFYLRYHLRIRNQRFIEDDLKYINNKNEWFRCYRIVLLLFIRMDWIIFFIINYTNQESYVAE